MNNQDQLRHQQATSSIMSKILSGKVDIRDTHVHPISPVTKAVVLRQRDFLLQNYVDGNGPRMFEEARIILKRQLLIIAYTQALTHRATEFMNFLHAREMCVQKYFNDLMSSRLKRYEYARFTPTVCSDIRAAAANPTKANIIMALSAVAVVANMDKVVVEGLKSPAIAMAAAGIMFHETIIQVDKWMLEFGLDE